jgi:cytidyltransferase-like protein
LADARAVRFIVYAPVVADLFHAGHVSFFRKARALGERTSGTEIELLVGVHSDDDVATYKRRPHMSMDERIAVVEACRYVDRIVPASPLVVTERFISEHAIDLVVHGDDFDQAQLEGFFSVPMRLGIFATVPYSHITEPGDEPLSTSTIIDRVRGDQ